MAELTLMKNAAEQQLAAELERRGYGTFADHLDGDGPDAAPLAKAHPSAGQGGGIRHASQ